MTPEAPPADPTDTSVSESVLAAIPVRRPDLELSREIPRHWNGGDAFASHFFDALSSTFPDGEAFFVRSVQRYRDRIDDPALRRAMQAFAGQEAQHRRQHAQHVELLLAQGYRGIETRNRWVRRGLELSARVAPLASLATTAALEHLTAILARRLLSEPERWCARMDPRMARLWLWHALEESEHKAVAFEVLRRVAPGRLRRALCQALNSAALVVETLDRTLYMLWKDGLLFRRETWRSGWRFLFGRGEGAGFLRGLGADYAQWYRRDFHPDDVDDAPLIERGRARLAA